MSVRCQWFAFLPILWFVSGCGGTQASAEDHETTMRRVELEEIRGLCNLCQAETSKAPSRLNDLEPFKEGFSVGFQAIQEGRAVVRWKAASGGKDEAVLAHGKNVPSQGGLVLLNNGTITSMTADAFQSATKAGS